MLLELKWKRLLRVTVALTAAAVLLGLFTFFRHGYDSTLMLADLAGLQTVLPDRCPAAGRSEIEYDANDGRRVADLYTPQGTAARAGLVLVPGAAEGGRRDPRLVEFAEILARAEFAVLVPDIPSFRELRPSPASVGEIAGDVGQLRNGGDLAPGLRLGIGAFSIASEPDAYGKWVYALSNAGRLQDPTDRTALAALARRKLDDAQANISGLLAVLGPDGRAVLDFIDNRDPARVPGLLAALPAVVRSDIEALDLAARNLSGLTADFILVHGLDDDIIPYTESVSLARALPPGRSQLFLLAGLHHVDRAVAGADAWRMWRALQALLSQRDGGTA